MTYKKRKSSSVRSWMVLIFVIILGSVILGTIYDTISNMFTAGSWGDFLKLTIISAVGGILLFVLYLIYSFVTERIHKKHPTWFAPQDPPSSKK